MNLFHSRSACNSFSIFSKPLLAMGLLLSSITNFDRLIQFAEEVATGDQTLIESSGSIEIPASTDGVANSTKTSTTRSNSKKPHALPILRANRKRKPISKPDNTTDGLSNSQHDISIHQHQSQDEHSIHPKNAEAKVKRTPKAPSKGGSTIMDFDDLYGDTYIPWATYMLADHFRSIIRSL